MLQRRKRPFTLAPLVTLTGLAVLFSTPYLVGSHLYAAPTPRYATVVVHRGDTLWQIAAARTGANGNIEDTVDGIAAANHLGLGAAILPGQRLRVPIN
ncbi:MAG TPA: LysM peptidoglycan-binding domain-containing protein [Candidatus Dormibacteraeota bacterium]|nr:LysM peptidoglycan-binding domain-containing protein [Candidatus Dormibacteraeota bacterium]